jgi:hypothetical protein
LQQKAVKATVGGILTMTRDPLFDYLPPGMGHAIIPDNNPAIKALKLKRSYLVFLDERPLN